MSTQVFMQVTADIRLSGVRPSYTFTAGIILYKNCEFDDSLSMTSAYVKDVET